MCRTETLYCDDAAGIVGELERVRRELAALEAKRTRLLDSLRRANETHEERIVSGPVRDPAETSPRHGRAAPDSAEWVERSTCVSVAALGPGVCANAAQTAASAATAATTRAGRRAEARTIRSSAREGFTMAGLAPCAGLHVRVQIRLSHV